MNISPDGTTVTFKTAPKELFLAEKSGAKSNTVRILDIEEYELLLAHTPIKIIIQYQQEIFLRTLTNLHFAKLFGKVIVIFSWTNEEHSVSFEHGDLSVGPQEEEEEEEPSIDERFAAITISNGTLALLQSIAHGRTMNMVIKELYEEYMCTRAKEWGPRHD
jgi:hypothetical protein